MSKINDMKGYITSSPNQKQKQNIFGIVDEQKQKLMKMHAINGRLRCFLKLGRMEDAILIAKTFSQNENDNKNV